MKFFDLYKDLEIAHQKSLIVALSHFRHVSYSKLRLQNDIFLTLEEQHFLSHTLTRLKQKEPLTKILGCTEFYGFNFAVTTDVLDPRQDSEMLIDAVRTDYCDNHANLSFLDLGTGSGSLIITLLLLYPNAQGIALDFSEKALKVAEQNANFHKISNRITFYQGSWFDALPVAKQVAKFDCIITNPPYIKSDYPLDDSVKNYDPHEALYAGTDGLDDYIKIMPKVSEHLNNKGRFYCEIGFDQSIAVQDIIYRQKHLKFLQCIKDYSENDRVIVAEHC
ncbi:MAG: peptide chain release factor N(5)-glutamine methyltransferase [Alphaproteobacteria bacterium CG_4_10_14_0_8_um_filter_37_21]|nr:MAG: peptide chain release factor N(5)-glutamine methyltransferase [Alphaproteobacteria bacterium CG_4_10_14_0_8_um_filter_37_21]